MKCYNTWRKIAKRDYVIYDDHILIPLTNNKFCKIDLEDVDLVKYNWVSHKYNIKGKHIFYAEKWNSVKSPTTDNRMHRVIAARIIGRDLHDDEEVDHIDNDGLNNTRSNLRVVTGSQNGRNRSKGEFYKGQPTSSIYKGVSFYKNYGKYMVRIMVDKKSIFIGYFKNEIDAARAYDVAAKKYHREYAKLNFPED